MDSPRYPSAVDIIHNIQAEEINSVIITIPTNSEYVNEQNNTNDTDESIENKMPYLCMCIII